MIDAQTALGTFLQSFSGIEDFINVFVAFLGVVLTIMAVFKFVEYGRFGENMGGVSLLTPVMYLLSGAALFNFAASIDTFLQSIYGPSTSVHNLMSYSGGAGAEEKTVLFLTALVACVRLYGYWSFASGWMTLRKLGSNSHGQNDSFKQALIKLFAGAAMINIVETVNVVTSTFGFGDFLS